MKVAELKIKNLNWQVYYEEPLTSKEPSFQDGDCGDTVFMKTKIYLNSTLSDDLLYETIKHELVHAYMFSFGIGQVKWDEELVCDIIATHSEDILKDSKDIYKICKEEKNNG